MAIAGSRAAQEALDRAMMSARYTDTTGLESAIKMARKKGVTVGVAEARLRELKSEKQRLVPEEDDRGRLPADDDGMLSGPKVSQLRNTFDGTKSADKIVPPPPASEATTMSSSSSSSSSAPPAPPAPGGMTISPPRVKVPGGAGDMDIADKRRDAFSLFC
jgi:hypothetical protein